MRRCAVVCALIALACAAAACAGSSAAPSATVAHSDGVPQTPAAVARRLAAADAKLRASLRGWQTADPSLRTPPPAAALNAAATERAIVHQLARSGARARQTLAALPAGLRARFGADLLAAHDLRRLAGPPTNAPLHLVPPAPAGELLADYRQAQRRFGTHWQVLAAINLVESAFGRVATNSSAGAQGPMQFLPSTWREYGFGGNIHSPHAAILGAANYLHRSGAPANDRRAVFAYNPSDLYVDAVLAYAQQMSRDSLAYLIYYTWEASLPADE